MSESDEPHVYGMTDLTYGAYLKVPELLSLQVRQSDPPHHDELLFIVIHQAYELWFKLMIHELENCIRYMQKGEVLRAHHFVNRVVQITRLLVDQIHILETMAPVEFLQFRSRLMPASGFQSAQFRELEFLSGIKDEKYLRGFRHIPDVQARLRRRLAEPDLRSSYYEMLRGLGFPLPDDVSQAALDRDPAQRSALFAALRPIYEQAQDHLPLYLLTEALIDYDESFSLWRDHHVRVVERVIGLKRGTGGSSGVRYLQKTAAKRMFPALWELRTYLEAS